MNQGGGADRLRPERRQGAPTGEVAAGRLLLLGWEGTLVRDLPRGQRTPLPPPVVEAIGPMLREAEARIGAVAGRRELRLGGNELPVVQLTAGLQGRLGAVLGQAFAAGWDPEVSAGARDLAGRLVEDWVEWVEVFARRLRTDEASLGATMGVRGPVERMELTAAETHAGGGPGIRLRFAGGSRLFYKPRPVTGESLWAELQRIVQRVDPTCATEAGRTVAGAGYGWMEEVRQGTAREGLHWRRAGALLCLARSVAMGDLQMSNVVATGGGPAAVDAECLGGGGVCGGEVGTEEELLATGLLPQPNGDRGELPDVSGLFGGAAPVRGVTLPCWVRGGVGAWRLQPVGARLAEQRNQPPGSRSPLECLPEMLEGYAAARRATVGARPELLEPGGWLDRLRREHAPRVVLRSTLRYGLAMSRSIMPEALRSERERRGVLAEELGGPALQLQAEADALLPMRVPRFELRRGSRDVVAEGGLVVMENGAERTSADEVRRRLEALDGSEGDGEIGGSVTEALSSILFRARGMR